MKVEQHRKCQKTILSVVYTISNDAPWNVMFHCTYLSFFVFNVCTVCNLFYYTYRQEKKNSSDFNKPKHTKTKGTVYIMMTKPFFFFDWADLHELNNYCDSYYMYTYARLL